MMKTSLSKMMVKDNEFEIEDSDPDEDKMTDFTNYSRNRGKLCSKMTKNHNPIIQSNHINGPESNGNCGIFINLTIS